MREIVGAGGGRRGLVRELLFVGIFGLFFPLSQAEVWRTGSVPAVFALMIPLFLVGPHVADSFAGEKERGTLETLLATRLPDQSIYLGKIFAVVGYAWVVTLLEAWVAQNTGPFVYPGFVWAAWAVGSIASGLLLASIGTFVSLRSKTVRAAHQAMMIPLFIIIFGGSFGIPLLFRMLSPETQKVLLDRIETLSAVSVVLAAVAVLLLIDMVLLVIGLRRFRRDRLISD
jgi:ABC-2 type transport system permease protein